MGVKLPSTLLRRPCAAAPCSSPSSSSSSSPLLSSSPSWGPSTSSAAAAAPITHNTNLPLCAVQAMQRRHATLILRPRRCYTFTQVVRLSDGSTYTTRTTSPQALYRSERDSRNHLVWQPNEKSLRNVEVDEAGRLAGFRGRFGRGWDMEGPGAAGAGAEEGQEGGEEGAAAKKKMEEVAAKAEGAEFFGDEVEVEVEEPGKKKPTVRRIKVPAPTLRRVSGTYPTPGMKDVAQELKAAMAQEAEKPEESLGDLLSRYSDMAPKRDMTGLSAKEGRKSGKKKK